MHEPYTWKCPHCNAKGTAATKDDADLAYFLHLGMAHGNGGK